MELNCGDCSMVFHSTGLLEKHKAFFCIGGATEHPGVPRQSSEHLRDSARGIQPKQSRTPELVKLKGRQRNIRWRDVDAESQPGRAEVKPVAGQTDSASLQTLTDEFHKLRMSIEESLPNWAKWTTDTEACGCQLGRSERLKEMKEMAEHHERQLAQIHAHNQHLELQREELAHQLDVLSEQSSTSHLESLLTELREQEERNEETLQQLAEHLHALHAKETSAHADQPDPSEKKTFTLISSVDGPLSAQIKALRLAYIQSGGSDPAIVAQMMDLQAEAQTLEKDRPGATAKARRKNKKVKSPQWEQSWELLNLEQENQRLEEEILRLQLAREGHYGHEAAVKTELQLIQKKKLVRLMASLQAEMESLSREVERTSEAPRHRRQPPPPPPPSSPLPFPPQSVLYPLAHIHAPLALATSCTSPLGRHVMEPLDSLGPAPYDPEAGFVIFYDLVLGVDATLKVLRLVASLYLGGQEVGCLTPLPPVQCQPGGTLPYTHSPLPPGNYTSLSVKQPVPRMQPSPSLSLLVELQAAGGVDVYGQEVQKLESCGWARLELFDQYNQLHSGHWRAPVRSLPVQPSLSPSQLNCVPQVGNMELCIRLVNGWDGDVQSLAKPDPSYYKYLAVVCSHPATVQGNPALSISSPQPTGASQLPSHHQDPPPVEANQR